MKEKEKCKNCETTNPNQPTCKEMKPKRIYMTINCKSAELKEAKAEERERILKIIEKWFKDIIKVTGLTAIDRQNYEDLKSEIKGESK